METYTFTTESVIIKNLSEEIKSVLPGKQFILRKNGSNGTGVFDEALSSEEETIFDDTIVTHKSNYNTLILNKNILLKIQNILDNTIILLDVGFNYDSKVFSLTPDCREKWYFVYNDRVDKIFTTFPKNIPTLNHETYSLTEANVVAFYTAFIDKITPIIDGEMDLVTECNDATTQAELDAVVDTR